MHSRHSPFALYFGTPRTLFQNGVATLRTPCDPNRRWVQGHLNEVDDQGVLSPKLLENDEGDPQIGWSDEVVGYRVVSNIEIGFETYSKIPGNVIGRIDETAARPRRGGAETER